MKKINLSDEGLFDLDCNFLSDDIKAAAIECIEQQKLAAQKSYEQFKENTNAKTLVSFEHLKKILDQKKDIHGISTESSISNVICFGAENIENAILDAKTINLREKIDIAITKKLNDIFVENIAMKVCSSGHFWYPKGSYMGWHTNSQAPGWRIYINYAEEENESFFRYFDEKNKDIITLNDKKWNIRVFKISDKKPLWHCVYSNTNRFSLGYIVQTEQSKKTFLSRIKNLLR